MSGRLHLLARQHERLERRIDAEMKNPMPDHLRLQELKRQKLRIKDEMQHLPVERDRHFTTSHTLSTYASAARTAEAITENPQALSQAAAKGGES